ncbi:unnamed protein product [Paramecium pentaurelia]|uniref:Selenoprotein O n=1 Tax=Paramecium pentaurelia TaxID=43138 RepID=A0A8S1U282_9CILI|nr:unnamed protein product [Paramecium pentaurelia]
MKNIISALKVLPFENKICQLPIDDSKINKPRKVIGYCFSDVTPEQKENPRLIAHSKSAFSLINVDLDVKNEENIQILAGNLVPSLARPLAHCYCGYQFGNWAGQLGDGRAITLGDLNGYELQLKGSGLTPYSRFADGKAVIRSSIREYLCSEFMFHLNIPTTRAASLVITDTKAERDIYYDGHPIQENCAVVLRIAETFLRFGSFEVEIDLNPKNTIIPQLWNYCKKYYFADKENPFQEIVNRTAKLVAQWQCYGFCHGVLNTDNMSIIGLTIDYGPFGFIDYFNKNHICNNSDKEGRYSYANQPQVCLWNLNRLSEALESVIPKDQSKQIIQDSYWVQYKKWYYHYMLRKLGLIDENQMEFTKSQCILIDSFFDILHQSCTNFTKVFQILQQIEIPHQNYVDEEVELNQEDIKIIQQLVQISAPREVYLQMRKPKISKQQIDQFIQYAASSRQLLHMFGIDENWLQQQIQLYKEYEQIQVISEQERLKIISLLWSDWVMQYKSETNQANRIQIMEQMNPKYTITNTVLQTIIQEVETNQNFGLLQKIQSVIENPYVKHTEVDEIFNQICNNEICVSCSS